MVGIPLHENALGFAVALPVVTIAAMNAFLFLTGERGTLLLPVSPRLAATGTPDPFAALSPAPVCEIVRIAAPCGTRSPATREPDVVNEDELAEAA